MTGTVEEGWTRCRGGGESGWTEGYCWQDSSPEDRVSQGDLCHRGVREEALLGCELVRTGCSQSAHQEVYPHAPGTGLSWLRGCGRWSSASSLVFDSSDGRQEAGAQPGSCSALLVKWLLCSILLCKGTACGVVVTLHLRISFPSIFF